MKKLITIMIAGLGLMFASVAMADPAEGIWKTEPGDSGGYLHVEISMCGANVCGVIIAAIDKDGLNDGAYEHLGKTMLWDMGIDGGGSYSGGQIWAADKDKTYSSKMTLSGGILVVKGCVAGGLICRGQDWTRL